MLISFKNILLIAACSSLLTACDKKLDLAPEDTLTEKIALSNQNTAEAALGDAYLKLYEACKAEAYIIGDLTTGMCSNFAGVNDRFYTGNLSPVEKQFNPFWENNYKTINLANVIIEKLPSAGKFDESLKKQLVAEAKFIRAFSYTNLLKLYGDGALENKPSNMGVPLRVQGYEGYDGSQIIPRNTNGEVYAQILKDIDGAIPDLLKSFPSPLATRSRATKGAANALGARVAMYIKDDAKAIAYGEQVLGNDTYVLANSITSVFPDNTNAGNSISIDIPELIFAFPVSWNNNIYDETGIYYYFGFAFPSDQFLATYAAKDIRGSSMLVPGAPWSTHPTPRKFSHSQNRDNLSVIRLAETVLTSAEALTNKNGINQEAVDLLNSIHQRSFASGDKPAPFTMASFANKQALLDAIWQERRWELAFEGFDKFDRIRTGQKPNPVLPATKYALPVPFSEIAITSGVIKQNPGYTN